MNLYKLILTKNACYIAGEKIKPKGIMVHSTGANNPKLKRYVGPNDGRLGLNLYGNHWNTYQPGGKYKCVHAFIGKLKDGSIATYQTLPWDHKGWHCSEGPKGSGNDTHISFEICEDALKDANYFNAVYKEAVELCAYLCKKFVLTEKDIICHCEGHAKGLASNHGDVMHWFPLHGKSMDTLRADVKALISAETNKVEKPVKVDVAKNYTKAKAGSYKVKNESGTQLRSGAKISKAFLEDLPKGSKVRCYGYHTGKWLYVVSPKGKVGFCCIDFLTKV